MRQRQDPEGLRLPVKLDSTSNGEFEPVPLNDGCPLVPFAALREKCFFFVSFVSFVVNITAPADGSGAASGGR
ncbi:hypothetical protein B1C78_03630 [Thioalkalivibrio denitrificans]|uniref:Uncharacterized protein n=1 Tax=Thioalkalivibrio denitrificans TaxID=108003 RepID=A0A1V3NR97_9GAMM|nr:hypothetical protein [Thioalkalivibrio denitrificans]OOG27571.1 hypothetical protein B1C78_03630 [Thioalkalivibrio denitrificans]